MQHIELHMYSIGALVARNLNVAVQPAVADIRWLPSKMDFRSNEAGRTALRFQRGRVSVSR
jgi:hypothetical protein